MPHPNASLPALLSRLTDEQRHAATVDGDVCVIAGAGTGKTTTMCARVALAVASGRVAPGRVLALTHSRRAAGEMRERMLALGVDGPRVRTFHSAAWAQLQAADGRAPKLLESPHRMLRQILGRAADVDEILTDLVAEIGWAQASLLTPGTYGSSAGSSGRRSSLDPERVASVWERFERTKRAQGLEDFGDILLRAARTGFDGHWDLVLVDEYQDTDPAQQQLFEHWAAASAERAVVGDPRQAIYGFKAASAAFIDTFAADPSVAVVHLTRSFRSGKGICDAANRLQPGLPGLEPTGPGPVPAVVAATDEDAEEAELIRSLRRWYAEGVPFEQMAVLARFRAVLARFEAALTRAGVPYNTGEDERFFDQPDVKQTLAEFARQAKAHPDEAGLVLLRDIVEVAGWVRDQPPEGLGAARRRWELHTALVEMVERIPSAEDLAARFLLDELVVRFREAHVPGPPGVSLLTVHAAKGLEWDAVAVVGAADGAFPSVYARTRTEQTEERNVFYVAVTRARHHLLVTLPERRNGRQAKPSPFLADIDPTRGAATKPLSAGPADGHAADPVPGAGRCRCGVRLLGAGARSLGVCAQHLDGEQAQLAARVRAWRDAEAARLGRSPDRVCPDQALLSIVASGSADAATLAGIARLASDADLTALAASLAA